MNTLITPEILRAFALERGWKSIPKMPNTLNAPETLFLQLHIPTSSPLNEEAVRALVRVLAEEEALPDDIVRAELDAKVAKPKSVPWLQTRQGQIYDLVNPDPKTIVLSDVCFHLERINRYSGAVDYTVAEHLVYCYERTKGMDNVVRRAVVAHDLHEAFIGDVPSPVKKALGPAWAEFEKVHELAFRDRFNIYSDDEVQKAVRIVDARALLSERRDLLQGHEAKPWGIPGEPFPEKVTRRKGELLDLLKSLYFKEQDPR